MEELYEWIYDDITWCENECSNIKCERNISNRLCKDPVYSYSYFKDTDMCLLKEDKNDLSTKHV